MKHKVGRKARKRLRKLKQKKEKKKKVINEFLMQIAEVLTHRRVENANEVFQCGVCKQAYCIAYDGGEVFCRTCFYRKGCIKIATTQRCCKECEE